MGKSTTMAIFNSYVQYLWYPLVICYIAIENGPFIVDFPIENGDLVSIFGQNISIIYGS